VHVCACAKLIVIVFFFYLHMSPFKPPPNFKFKYFYRSHNPSNGTFIVACDVASNIKSEHQSFCEFTTLKGKQPTTKVLVICLNALNFPTTFLSIDFPKLQDGLDQSSMSPLEVNKTHAIYQKRNLRFHGQLSYLGLNCNWGLMIVCI